jgi:hypothetical protein
LGKKTWQEEEFANSRCIAELAVTVPTTISDSTVEILNRIVNSVAAKARPTQSAQRAQVFVMSTNS